MAQRLSQAQLRDRFYHPPPHDKNDAAVHADIRAEVYNVACTFNAVLPPGQEALAAIWKLEEAMFWADEAIARDLRGRAAAGSP